MKASGFAKDSGFAEDSGFAKESSDAKASGFAKDSDFAKKILDREIDNGSMVDSRNRQWIREKNSRSRNR